MLLENSTSSLVFLDFEDIGCVATSKLLTIGSLNLPILFICKALNTFFEILSLPKNNTFNYYFSLMPEKHLPITNFLKGYNLYIFTNI